MEQTTDTRFWSKVDKSGDCWLWLAGKDKFGYGYFRLNTNRSVRAYRYSYLLKYGSIPEKHDIHHLCENPPCVNPKHLTPLPHSLHMKMSPRWGGAINARKTHCKRGHVLGGSNLATNALKKGHRRCRTCDNDRQNRVYQENKEAKREYARKYYATNLEKMREYNRGKGKRMRAKRKAYKAMHV